MKLHQCCSHQSEVFPLTKQEDDELCCSLMDKTDPLFSAACKSVPGSQPKFNRISTMVTILVDLFSIYFKTFGFLYCII